MLAIIIPYYKFTFFEDTLQSLANQTDKRFKVYIGDDASPESPIELLDKFKGKFDFEYHRFENNLGGTSLTQQWERCIMLSGDVEWLMVLGDDDVLGENVISEFYKQFLFFKEKANLVRYSTVILYENYEKVSHLFEHPQFEKVLDFISRKLQTHTRSSLSEYVFRKSSYLKYKFDDYPSAFYSDDIAWIKFSENKLIFTINNATIYIRISPLSISGSADKNNKSLKKANLKYLLYLFNNKYEYFDQVTKKNIVGNLQDAMIINKCFNLKIWFAVYIATFEIYDSNFFYKFHLKILRNIIRK